MRKILPHIHKASTVVATKSTNVPIRSNKGGSAFARFIIVNGVYNGIHESNRASGPFGSFGMNVIVSTQTHVVALVVLLAVMTVMSAALLLWARRKGWW